MVCTILRLKYTHWCLLHVFGVRLEFWFSEDMRKCLWPTWRRVFWVNKGCRSRLALNRCTARDQAVSCCNYTRHSNCFIVPCDKWWWQWAMCICITGITSRYHVFWLVHLLLNRTLLNSRHIDVVLSTVIKSSDGSEQKVLSWSRKRMQMWWPVDPINFAFLFKFVIFSPLLLKHVLPMTELHS